MIPAKKVFKLKGYVLLTRDKKIKKDILII